MLSFKPIGSGHINTTMLLEYDAKQVHWWYKSSIQWCFRSHSQLVDNARLIEQHLSNKQQVGEFNLAIVRHVATTVQQDYLVQAE